MAKMGFRNMQELIGRTDKLKFSPHANNAKAKLLNFDAILQNALDLQPGVNIHGGTVAQDFKIESRLVRTTTLLESWCILPIYYPA